MIRDVKTGFQRHLTYDELLRREKAEEAASITHPAPGILREATRLVLSPFWERFFETPDEADGTQVTHVFPHEALA